MPHVRALAGCSAGLFLGLKLAGVGAGDEVLLPTLTFAGCANVVEQLGARPRLVDSEPGTGLVDLEAAERLVGPRTKAILPVHLGGRPLDMDRLAAFRDRFGVAVVEDAAHAIGAAWGGRPIGSHGNFTSFSFHATKNMTTVEGGALALQRAEDAERVARLALVERANLREHAPPRGADLVLANLMRPLLLRVAELLGERRPPSLIASGLLEEEADEVVAAFAPMAQGRRIADQGWCAVLLRLPPLKARWCSIAHHADRT